MRHIFLISLNHLRLLSRDRANYLLLLALPLALTFITGILFGGETGTTDPVPLAVVDLDGSDISRYMAGALDTKTMSVQFYQEEEARELVKKRHVSAAVIIPAGFAKTLEAGRNVKVTVIRADLQESPGLVEQQVTRLLYRVRANTAAAALGEVKSGAQWEEIFFQAEKKWTPSPVRVDMETLSARQDEHIPSGYRHSSPGFVVMFGMMTIITAGAGTLLAERESGTLSRLLSAPLGRFQLLSGKMAGLMVSGIAQMAILIAAGWLFFNVEWGRNLPALFLLVGGLAFASTGFGMILASTCRTRTQAEAIGVLSVVVMSMLGGTWWPLELLPSHMQILSRAVPSGWAMEGFVALVMRGAGLHQAALPVLVLFAFGAVFLALSAVFFKYYR